MIREMPNPAPITAATAAALLALAAAGQTLPPATTGDLLVSSSGNDRLLRLDFGGTELASLPLPGLAHPRGLAVSPTGTVYVASQNSGEVLELDRRLQLVRRFATGPVVGPTGIALRTNGNLLVAGFSSSNVGEFRPDGTLVRTFADPKLRFTNCVALLPDGSFFAASAGNGTVVYFDSTGTARFDATGFGLSSPMGLAVWNNELFVAGGGSNNIVVFDLAGAPLRELRHADLSGPQGIAVTAGGELVSASFFTHKVVWLKPDGTWLRTAAPGSSLVPRSVAFLPSASLLTTGSPTLGTPYPFTVDSPHEPGLAYATGMALAQAPAIPLPRGRTLPLAADALFQLSLSGAPAFAGFVGLLDGQGKGTPVLNLPNLAALQGVTVHAAAVTLDPAWPTLFRQVTAATSWTL